MSFAILKKLFSGLKSSLIGTRNMAHLYAQIPLKPQWLVFVVTEKCNSRCTHCNIWKTDNLVPPLTPAEIEKTLRDPLFSETKYIQVSGGEPTTRGDLDEVILSIHRAVPGATIQISTNALLPARVLKVARTALDAGIELYIGISLDGIGDDHDKIRGIKGNFNKADKLLRELVEIRGRSAGKLTISVGIVISDLTLKSVDAVRSYTEGLNVELTEAWYNESSFYGNLGKHSFSANLNEAIKSQSPSPLKELWLKELKGESIKFPCFAMNTFCVLKANGDIVPCLNYYNESAGNVRKATPSDIWRSMQMKKVRKTVKECRGCLNSWGAGWSINSSYYQTIVFYFKHPLATLKLLIKD